jgi:hypothetical protein
MKGTLLREVVIVKSLLLAIQIPIVYMVAIKPIGVKAKLGVPLRMRIHQYLEVSRRELRGTSPQI